MSRYIADDVYCIPGTAVLKNKAGITNQDLLDEYEADFTAIRIFELAQAPLKGNFDLTHLCKIHAYLFQDVYEWAGEIRSVYIIRGDSRVGAMFGLIRVDHAFWFGKSGRCSSK